MDAEEAERFDAQAVASALAGDTDAYDKLIIKYQRRAVAVSYRLLGNINDAMDVCQESFLRAYRSLSSLEQPGRFGAWFMRIVSNLSLNFRRQRRPQLSLTTDDESGGIAETWSAANQQKLATPSDSMSGKETQAAITAAVEALPEQQRLCLVMFAMEGIPQKEVAEILGCSVEMVKWNVFQARKTLKDTLAEFIEE
jgi:RNA polymerase sigma-70 factor (ECF subfamily)